MVAADAGEAIKKAKGTAFYKHTGFAGAPSHIDDKYGIDVDDVVNVADILAPELKDRYKLELEYVGTNNNDEVHLGYLPLVKLRR